MRKMARVGDKAFCPSDGHGKKCCSHAVQGPAIQGSPNVFVNGQKALRVGDPGVHSSCCGANSWKVASGCSTVYINNLPAVRIQDETSHCGGGGKLIEGSPNVFLDDKVKLFPTRLYNEQYRALDEDGEPMCHVPFYIKDASGRVFKGFTEEDGLCPRVFTDNEESLEIYLGLAAMEKWEA